MKRKNVYLLTSLILIFLASLLLLLVIPIKTKLKNTFPFIVNNNNNTFLLLNKHQNGLLHSEKELNVKIVNSNFNFYYKLNTNSVFYYQSFQKIAISLSQNDEVLVSAVLQDVKSIAFIWTVI